MFSLVFLICQVSFDYNKETGVFTVSGEGSYTKDDINRIFPHSKNYTSLVIDGKFEEIPDEAFSSCPTMTTVTIKADIKRIGVGSFRNCSKFASFTIPPTVETVEFRAFASCAALTEVYYHLHTMTFANAVFNGCKSLKTFKQVANDTTTAVADKTHTYGDYCFTGCTALNDFAFPDDVIIFNAACFQGCTAISVFKAPPHLRKVGDNCFKGCNKLQTFNAPSLQIIGDNVFESCSKLNNFVFKELLEIGKYAFKFTTFSNIDALNALDYTFKGFCFYQNANLVHFIVPYKMEFIPEFAFYGCTRLESIIYRGPIRAIKNSAFRGTNIIDFQVPSTCEIIEPLVFAEMNRLSTISVDPSNKNFYYDDYYKILYGYNNTDIIHFIWNRNVPDVHILDSVELIDTGVFTDCPYLRSINMPANLKNISSQAFRKCTSLQEIIFPQHIEVLGHMAFYWCTSLAKVDLGGIKIIEPEAFAKCTALKEIIFSPNLTEIRSGAFLGCTALQNITLPPRLKVLGRGAFYQCDIRNVSIPQGVSEVHNTVFALNANLNSAVFNGTISKVHRAFFKSPLITEVNFMCNIDEISSDAFWFTEKLATITYCGNKTVGGIALFNRTVKVLTSANYTAKKFAGAEVTQDPDVCKDLDLQKDFICGNITDDSGDDTGGGGDDDDKHNGKTVYIVVGVVSVLVVVVVIVLVYVLCNRKKEHQDYISIENPQHRSYTNQL